MNWTVVQRILGLLLMMFSLTMLPPVLIALVFNEQAWLPFVEGFGITLAAGLICWLPVHRVRKDLRLRDGFLIVAAFWTLWNLRGPLVSGIRKALADIQLGDEAGERSPRTEVDLPLNRVIVAIGAMGVATFFLYNYFTDSIVGAAILTAVMLILGFLFAAVAGYLVGLIGNSNNPISGLTLTALLVAAVLMVAIGLTDMSGVAGVLAVAGVEPGSWQWPQLGQLLLEPIPHNLAMSAVNP